MPQERIMWGETTILGLLETHGDHTGRKIRRKTEAAFSPLGFIFFLFSFSLELSSHGSCALSLYSLILFLLGESINLSIVFGSLWPHGLQPTKLLCPWHSPEKNTALGCILFSWGFSQFRDRTRVSCIAGEFFTIWATRQVLALTTLLVRVYL